MSIITLCCRYNRAIPFVTTPKLNKYKLLRIVAVDRLLAYLAHYASPPSILSILNVFDKGSS